MERRDFVKTGLMASSGAFFMGSYLGCTGTEPKDKKLKEYFTQFQNPPGDSRLFVRWWLRSILLHFPGMLIRLDMKL